MKKLCQKFVPLMLSLLLISGIFPFTALQAYAAASIKTEQALPTTAAKESLYKNKTTGCLVNVRQLACFIR